MLITQYVDNNTRIRHYSNEDLMILQIETNILYEDAIDILPCPYTYVETDIPIEHLDPNALIPEEEILGEV